MLTRTIFIARGNVIVLTNETLAKADKKKYMKKTCKKCNQPFDCNKENIAECHCYSVKISEENKLFIASKFEDCLCNNCLVLFTEKKK